MATLIEVATRVTISDPTGQQVYEAPPTRFSPASGLPKVEVVSLTGSAFNALSPPAGAKALLIRPGTATSLTLKGINGDSASITLTPASNALSADMFLTLGAAPVLGILNGGPTVNIQLVWM